MSILIKGMEMPKGDEMPCANVYPDGKVYIDLDLECKRIGAAIPVPPHGRLIDADELKNVGMIFANAINEDGQIYVPLVGVIKNIDNAPTIIEAEEGE